MTTTQAALAPDTTRKPNPAKATAAITWHLIHLTWIWYELWLPLTIAAWILHTGHLPPIWWLALLAVIIKVQSFRTELVNNIHDTIRASIILAARLDTATGRPHPKILDVELGTWLGPLATVKLLRRYRWRAIPYTTATITVLPQAHQGADAWIESWVDYARRRHGFPDAGHDTNPKDRNTYLVRLERDKMPDRIEAI